MFIDSEKRLKQLSDEAKKNTEDLEEAKKNTKAPTVIEFIIDPEEMVYPMIKPGGTLEDMIMDC